MSFKEWLYDELINDGIICEDEFDIEELTVSLLLESTELDGYDIESYREQFQERCSNYNATPEWDVE